MQTANQSWPERIMNGLRTVADEGMDYLSFDVTRKLLLSLLLGLVGGLILGLFLGWVVWPVQWTNTQPTHLETDAKAHYIAAVADAFVATGGDSFALETARMRLIGMDGDDFTAARLYFANTVPGSSAAQNPDVDDPLLGSESVYRLWAGQQRLSFDSNIRLNNINQLASSLGLVLGTLPQSSTVQGDTSLQVEQPAASLDTNSQGLEQTTAEQNSAQQSVDSEPADATASTGFFNNGLGRAVACLTALMLVFGGAYILVRLNQRMKWIERPLNLNRERIFGAAENDDDPWQDGDGSPNEPFDDDWVGPGDGRSNRPTRSSEWSDGGLSADTESVDVDTVYDADPFDDDPDYDRDSDEFVERYTDIGPAALGEPSAPQMPPSTPLPPSQATAVPAYQASMRQRESRPAESQVPRQRTSSSFTEQPPRNYEPAEPERPYWDDDQDMAPPPADYADSGATDLGRFGGRYGDSEFANPAYDGPAYDRPDDGEETQLGTSYIAPPSFDDDSWRTSERASVVSTSMDDLHSLGSEPPSSRGNSGADLGVGTKRSPDRTRRTVLEFTATYERGKSVDYEEKEQIFIDREGADDFGRNVGECGLGVNFKNGILLNNPYDVIALDVWLLDKVELEELTSIKRILISEYVIERELEDVIQRENHSDGEPLVPQPGLEFELLGNNLSLTCRVLRASYHQEGEQRGVFDSLVLQMTVYSNL